MLVGNPFEVIVFGTHMKLNLHQTFVGPYLHYISSKIKVQVL